MEYIEEVSAAEARAQQDAVCAGCKIPLVEPAARTPICPACREQFIKFPIPLWIKGFGGGILLLVLFCLSTFPKNLQTGAHFQKGKTAAEQHNYFTAQKEFAEVVKLQPQYLEAQCRLLIAAYYNDDLATVINVLPQIEGKNLDDDELYTDVNNILSAGSRSLPSDSFSRYVEKHRLRSDSIPVEAYQDFLSGNYNDDFARTQLASLYFDLDQRAAADSLVNIVLRNDPDFHPALLLKIPFKRDLLQFDSAFYYADKILATNHEHSYALAAKARVLLKQKKDREALALAKQCYTIHETDGYTLATLAMAYHFNQDEKNRDAILAKAEKDTTATSYLTVAKDIISGKEDFRN